MLGVKGAKAVKIGQHASRSRLTAFATDPVRHSDSSNYFTPTVPKVQDHNQSFFGSNPAPSAGPTNLAIVQDVSSYGSRSGQAGHKQESSKTGSGRIRFDYASRVAASQFHFAAVNGPYQTKNSEDDDEKKHQRRILPARRRHSASLRPPSPPSSRLIRTTSTVDVGHYGSDSLTVAFSTHTEEIPTPSASLSDYALSRLHRSTRLVGSSSRTEMPFFTSRPLISAATTSPVRLMSTASVAEHQSGPTSELMPSAKVDDSAPTQETAFEAQPSVVRPPVRPRSSSAPPLRRQPLSTLPEAEPFIVDIQTASSLGNSEDVATAIGRYRQSGQFSVQAHNVALLAAAKSRQVGGSVQPVMSLLEEMLTHKSLAPTLQTYGIVIEVLANRDAEVDHKIQQLVAEKKVSTQSEETRKEAADKLNSLREEYASSSAFQMYAALGPKAGQLPASSHLALLRRAVARKRLQTGLSLFQRQTRGGRTVRPLFQTYSLMIDLYATAKPEYTSKARGLFDTYRDLKAHNVFDQPSAQDEHFQEPATAELGVWNSMLNFYIQADDSHAATALFEDLLGAEGLQPDISTFGVLLPGLARIEGYETLRRWMDQIRQLGVYSNAAASEKAALGFKLIDALGAYKERDQLSPKALADVLAFASIDRDSSTYLALLQSPFMRQQKVSTADIVDPAFDQEVVSAAQRSLVEQSNIDEASAPPSPESQASTVPTSLFSQTAPASFTSFTDSMSDLQPRSVSPAPSYLTQGPDLTDPLDAQLDTALARQVVDGLDWQAPQYRSNLVTLAEKVLESARKGQYIGTKVLVDLITHVSRGGHNNLVEQLYTSGYKSLGLFANDPEEQFDRWRQLEDGALIANANLGQLDRVAIHRDRLVAAGSAPSGEAYGAMILNARDTTDDATVAIELFQESRRLNVVPTTYLFNNLISRLSKARRTTAVLECFEQMKAAGVPTSSVTYGAVINACCKVGDMESAETLFEEMTNTSDFVPRVPPFNTMIQFFVTTQPDRTKALYYYNRMLDARVYPSAHTYRLLLDCYGQMQPVDTANMRNAFARLTRDARVQVQGVHWASLIYSYGVHQKDFEQAISVFDDISQKPVGQTRTQETTLPDAICYEAIVNVCNENGRGDLVEGFVDRMKVSRIASTAYIENARIQAFAQQNQLEKARQIFESLADPASGVAASGNHPDGRNRRPIALRTAVNGIVYREPSTFHTMIAAEMAAGEQEKATQVLEIARRRAFPLPVFRRLEQDATKPTTLGESAETEQPT